MAPRLLPLVLAALLAAPLTTVRSAEPGFPRDLTQAIFATAFDVVLDRSLDAVDPAQIGLWTLGGLALLDPGLRPELRAGTLLLSGPTGRLIAARPLPPPAPARPGDAADPLAVALAALFDAAWRASPDLRAAGADRMLRGAFGALLGRLDPYSRYLPPEEAAAARERRVGHSALGLGLAAGPRGGVVLTAVEPGGAAARAGLRAGDRLVAVDGVPVSARDLGAALAYLEGPAGTDVALRVRRGGRALDVLLPREVTPPDTVRAERRDDILWLRVEGFANETDRQLAAALESGGFPAGAPPVRGVVLDLRGNRGGLLTQAVAVASTFLPAGAPVARTTGRHPDAARVHRSDAADRAEGRPVVVLVDGRTASAAEVVAAALADEGRAVAVGSATQGKGVVQVVAELPNGGELLVTWARVLAPRGWPIQDLGVLPALCTDGGADAVAAALAALRRGEPPPMAPVLARARAARIPLPAGEAAALRGACPPAEGADATDLAAARALIEAPLAYAAALAPP